MENYEAEFADLEEAKKQARKLEEAKKCKAALILTIVASSILICVGALAMFVPLSVSSRGFFLDFAFNMAKSGADGVPVAMISFMWVLFALACMAPSIWDLTAAINLLRNKKIDKLDYFEVAGQPLKGTTVIDLFFVGFVFFRLGSGGALQFGLGLSGWYWFFVVLSVAAWIVGVVGNFMVTGLLKERKEREKYSVQ